MLTHTLPGHFYLPESNKTDNSEHNSILKQSDEASLISFQERAKKKNNNNLIPSLYALIGLSGSQDTTLSSSSSALIWQPAPQHLLTLAVSEGSARQSAATPIVAYLTNLVYTGGGCKVKLVALVQIVGLGAGGGGA